MLTAKDANKVLKQLTRRSSLRTQVAPKTTVAHGHLSTSTSNSNPEEGCYSNTISFATPESDFCSSHILMKSQADFDHHEPVQSGGEQKIIYQGNNQDSIETKWSGGLSFTSPESDFTYGFSSPINLNQDITQTNEKATKETKETFFKHLDQSSRNDLAYSLSFASAESDFSNPEFAAMLSAYQKKQLQNTSLLAKLPIHKDANQLSSVVNRREVEELKNAQEKVNHELQEDSKTIEYEELRAHADLLSHEEPLPTSMEEATVKNDDRAIVITEAEVPFRIVNVNSAWENLCGYSKDECKGQTLKCIQGSETNQAAVTALMSQLLRGEEAGTVLVNYRKDGSKFLNRLRVGALRDDANTVTHFVGILKEVEEMTDHFDEGSRILA